MVYYLLYYLINPYFVLLTLHRRHMVDILHPNAAGQNKVLGCLRDLVQPMVDAYRASNEDAAF
jgi:hypothetical protein